MRQGLNHSQPPVSVPIRASIPSRDHQRRVHGEQRGQLGFVGLELIPGRPDRGVLVRRVLQLDHAQRQTVHEKHHVRPPRVAVLGDAELVDRQPVVGIGFLEVDDLDLISLHPALGVAILDLDAVHQHPVESAVARFQDRALGPRQLAERIVQRRSRQAGVQRGEGIPQPPLQHHLSVVGALRLRRVWRDVGSVDHLPAEGAKPVQRGLLDIGFGEGGHGPARRSPGFSLCIMGSPQALLCITISSI